ncbi:MAG: 16S rRNA (guanine(966)-N(2))-methyltransferase RsmD [Clostridia bacterium]|nr:16S rRNA (guanine(966)-N(2))-methyltransferase RsmD [Clostridia bacterium]
MRVISGSRGGLPLKTLSGLDTRPTTDKVKGCIFNILYDKVADADVLDLFSGSGAMGIEALSRGAKSATLVDSSQKSAEIIKKNLEFTRLLANVICRPADKFLLGCNEKFDIIFMDPPYFSGHIADCMKIIAEKNLLADDGIIVAESDRQEVFPAEISSFVLKDERFYGRVAVRFYGK